MLRDSLDSLEDLTPSLCHRSISRSARMLSLAVALLLLTLGSGCPGGEPAVQSKCLKVGDRCRLRPGVLGVCTSGEGNTSSATDLVCTPQH